MLADCSKSSRVKAHQPIWPGHWLLFFSARTLLTLRLKIEAIKFWSMSGSFCADNCTSGGIQKREGIHVRVQLRPELQQGKFLEQVSLRVNPTIQSSKNGCGKQHWSGLCQTQSLKSPLLQFQRLSLQQFREYTIMGEQLQPFIPICMGIERLNLPRPLKAKMQWLILAKMQPLIFGVSKLLSIFFENTWCVNRTTEISNIWKVNC